MTTYVIARWAATAKEWATRNNVTDYKYVHVLNDTAFRGIERGSEVVVLTDVLPLLTIQLIQERGLVVKRPK